MWLNQMSYLESWYAFTYDTNFMKISLLLTEQTSSNAYYYFIIEQMDMVKWDEVNGTELMSWRTTRKTSLLAQRPRYKAGTSSMVYLGDSGCLMDISSHGVASTLSKVGKPNFSYQPVLDQFNEVEKEGFTDGIPRPYQLFREALCWKEMELDISSSENV